MSRIPVAPTPVAPASKKPFNVLEAIERLSAEVRSLKGAAAGYSSFKRLLETPADAEPADNAPIVSGPANFNGEPVEVVTDFGQLDAAGRAAVMPPLINLHAVLLLATLRNINQVSGELLAVMNDTKGP